MHFDMTKPCADCPFRADITFYLDPKRAQAILDAILVHDQTFACHNTLHGARDDEGAYQATGTEQHCAGALILAERLNRPNQLTRIAERLGLYDRTQLALDAPVFASPRAMVARMRHLHTRRRRHEQTA